MRVVIAMSGGVDSSVAAAKLVDEGHEVIGMTLVLWDGSNPEDRDLSSVSQDVRDAQRVAHLLGFPHHVLDWRQVFRKKIIDPFVQSYLHGITPSPCARCNQKIKLPALLDTARQMNADGIATGHYARVVNRPHGPRIARGLDPSKDQSYFLFALDTSTLSKLELPLGEQTKESVRREALDRGLVGDDQRESQDLCFLPDGNYARFVRQWAPEGIRDGWFVDTQGRKLAPHRGIHNFTLGQRKGLGFSIGRPLFVKRIDPITGTVVVDDKPSNQVRTIRIASPKVAAGVQLPLRALVQVRYQDAGVMADLRMCRDDHLEAVFEQSVSVVSPGQYAVAYVDDEVVAGGVIESFQSDD